MSKYSSENRLAYNLRKYWQTEHDISERCDEFVWFDARNKIWKNIGSVYFEHIICFAIEELVQLKTTYEVIKK